MKVYAIELDSRLHGNDECMREDPELDSRLHGNDECMNGNDECMREDDEKSRDDGHLCNIT